MNIILKCEPAEFVTYVTIPVEDLGITESEWRKMQPQQQRDALDSYVRKHVTIIAKRQTHTVVA